MGNTGLDKTKMYQNVWHTFSGRVRVKQHAKVQGIINIKYTKNE